MKNRVIMLLQALCIVVCLSGCQKRDTPLHKLGDVIRSEIAKMEPYAIRGQLEELLCTTDPLNTYETKKAYCARGLAEATDGMMKELEALITKTIEVELKKDPKALETEDSYGLTPAHRMVFGIFLFKRGGYFGFTPWPGEKKLVDHAFAFALDKLRTNKRVLSNVTAHDMLSGYLVYLGITKTPMSVGEFLNKIIGSGELGGANEWEKVRALKLT